MNLMPLVYISIYFFSSRRRHTRWPRDWSSDVCSSDLSAHSDVYKPGDHYKIEVTRMHDQINSRRAGSNLQRVPAFAEIGRASCRERREEGVVAGCCNERNQIKLWD